MITVIGSYAVGMTIKTERFPVAGETVPGHSFALLHGGKGSNQAVGCARLGGDVFYYTCLGKDTFGEEAMKLYREEGMDVSCMKFSDTMSTGVGLVTVNAEGENQITIDIGANNDVYPADIDKLLETIKKSSLVLMQLELGCDFARKRGHSMPPCKPSRGQWRLAALRPPQEKALQSEAQAGELEMILSQGREKGDPEKLAERFSFAYPAAYLPSKIAVSALTKSGVTLDQSPRFLMPDRVSGVDRGLAAHAFLQYVDWKKDLDEKGLLAQLSLMLEREQLTREEADALELGKLGRFFQSPLAARMKSSQGFQREWPFSLRMGARELFGVDSPAAVSVQGIIDACFLENEGWILVDYKTDYVRGRGPEAWQAAADRHAMQLQLYALALEKLTGKPVLERHIVLLSVGEALLVEPVSLEPLAWREIPPQALPSPEESVWDVREELSKALEPI